MPEITNKVLSVILGGGQGTRLFPLTRERSKPAVPLAGKYRLVDIPISNCINSDLSRIYLLTQFNSASLHRHISQSFKFDHFSGGFVEILAAEQTFTDTSWYQGTADAVRKNMIHFLNHQFDYLLILSGDQLYSMDFGKVIEQHKKTGAEVTIATLPVSRGEAKSLGIMQIDDSKRIVRFVEKPSEDSMLDTLKIDSAAFPDINLPPSEDRFLASMGIYVFNRDVIIKMLENALTDFGKHIIPNAIQTNKVYSYVFQGYWEDVGTIRSYFEANLDLANDLPRFNFFDMASPIFTHARFLPASKVNQAHIRNAVISDGCILNQCDIEQSIVGIRSWIDSGAKIKRTIIMGGDRYESEESLRKNKEIEKPRIGVGKNTTVEMAILDKNARIGDNCVITPKNKPENLDHPLYYIREGIVIIPKNAVIPNGTVL